MQDCTHACANLSVADKDAMRRSLEKRRDNLSWSVTTACVDATGGAADATIAVSLLAYQNASYVANHVSHTLRYLRAGSLLLLHLNALTRYREAAMTTSTNSAPVDADHGPWHAVLRPALANPRVLLNPRRIGVKRENGGSILVAHLLNVRHLLASGREVPAHVLLIASNTYALRSGVEAYVHCHTSSIRFAMATRTCVPDRICPFGRDWHADPMCRFAQLKASFVERLLDDGIASKCHHEGQFHPTHVFASLLSRLHTAFNESYVGRLSALAGSRLEETFLSSYAASQLPHLLILSREEIERTCLGLHQVSHCGPRVVIMCTDQLAMNSASPSSMGATLARSVAHLRAVASGGLRADAFFCKQSVWETGKNHLRPTDQAYHDMWAAVLAHMSAHSAADGTERAEPVHRSRVW